MHIYTINSIKLSGTLKMHDSLAVSLQIIVNRKLNCQGWLS